MTIALFGLVILAWAINGSEDRPTPAATVEPTPSVAVEPTPSVAVEEPKPVLAVAETPIPRSIAGDKGRYFLLESRLKGEITETLHKRIGPDGITGYTRTEINCQTMKVREVGYSETSPEDIKRSPLKWADLVPGSSKSDLAGFVCKAGG